jgi:hypothetical protein
MIRARAEKLKAAAVTPAEALQAMFMQEKERADNLEAECARLRTALEEIAARSWPGAHAFARAALEPTAEKA